MEADSIINYSYISKELTGSRNKIRADRSAKDEDFYFIEDLRLAIEDVICKHNK